jgi:hypothetical protein
MEEARLLLHGAGLDLPPIPAALASRLKRRGDWCYASRAVTRWPYLIEDYVAERTRGRRNDYVLLAHAGHGVNSYALHYYLVQPSVSLFLQVAWGGAYMNAAETTAAVNEIFGLARKLLDASKEAARGGHRRPPNDLLVVASSFYGGYISSRDADNLVLAPVTWTQSVPQDFLRQALERCRRP